MISRESVVQCQIADNKIKFINSNQDINTFCDALRDELHQYEIVQ